jgi:hypothetical protein
MERLKMELDALERRLRLQQQCGMVAAAGRTRHLIHRLCQRIRSVC